MKIKFQFNSRSSGQDVPEALALAKKCGGVLKNKFYVIEFNDPRDKNLVRLVDLVGHLKGSVINIDDGEPVFLSSPKKVYRTGPEMVLKTIRNYNSYKLRQNTLGYLQHEINERTGGALNSIKWICSDATPQYLFAQEDSTAPLSPLFSPLIVSSQRYDQLSDSRKFGYIFVDIASSDASITKGIDSTDLSDVEKEFYSAKIPLADMYGAFNYPIESVILHKVVNKELFSKALIASDYDVPDKVQNLYFTRPVDDLMDDSASNYKEGTEIYYICEIKFAKIIPDDDDLSEEDQRNLLAQATMYPILDYFDQHVFAATTGKMIGEIAYTEVLTLQSTSRSAIVVAAAGATIGIYQNLAKGANEGCALIGSSLLTTIAVQVATSSVKIVAQTIGEMFEEIVVDGFVEAYFENSARMLGWTAGVGQLISTLMTTVRETRMFGVFNLGGQSTDSQVQQDLRLLNTQLSQLIAERESSLSFTAEEFLRENSEEVRSIMSKLGLVPSRHETILKMAGIIGSGVFAGLSLLVPGLSFSGFSLYGFSPMIKHLGQKVLSPKAGTTTIMRAAIHNARQDMVISKEMDFKIEKLSGVKKGLGQDTELRSDSTATVGSIGSIGYTESAVEYMVYTKAKDFDANIYYALESQSSSHTFYDPSLIVENLEVQVELLRNRMQTIELFSKAKEISSNLEQKMVANPKKVSIVIESDTLMPQPDSRNGLNVWVHMIGSSEEKLIYIPSGANAEEINFEIRRQLKLSRDVPKLQIFYVKDGKPINLANEPDIIINDIVGTTRILKVIAEMAMHSGQSITCGDEIIAIPIWLFSPSFNYKAQRYNEELFQNAEKFVDLWDYLYKGKLNFDDIMFSYEDVKAFSDLYTYIESLSAEFLKENLKVIDKGQVNLQKLEDVFKTGYFYNIKFASRDKMAQLLEGKPPAQHTEIWDNYRAAVNEIYEVIFASGFKNRRLEKLTTEQSMYTILDIIMRKVVFIQEEPQFGGSGLYDIAPRIRDFLSSAVQSDLRKGILSPIGRYVFFDKFSEMFFDSEHFDVSLIKAYNSLKGRELEAQDCLNDFTSTLVDILSASEFVAFINGMNFGKVSLTSTLSKLGLNYYVEKHGSLSANEKRMFKFPITAIRNSNPTSDRSFIDDGGALVTDTTIYFREAKNSANPKAMTWSAKLGVANDLMRDAFMGVQIEFTKFQSGTSNILLKDLRNIVLTATAASRDGPTDLTAILNNMAKRTRFKEFRSGSSLKFPAMYTHLYACADLLDAKLGNTILSKQQAIVELQSYITSGEFLSKIEKAARLYYTDTHFSELPDIYFENVENYFLSNLQDLVIPSSSGSGFAVSLKERVNLLFKNLDSNGDPVKLKVSDLPADVMLFDGGQWIKLRDKFSEDHEMDSAYIIVHDKDTKMNGLMRIDSVLNSLPSGIEEGFYCKDTASGEVTIYNNVFASDAYGNYLFSRIDLSTFKAQEDGWYSKFTGTDGKLQKEAYIVFGFTASNQYLCFLFDALVNINPKEVYKEYLPGIIRPRSQKSRIKYDYIITDMDSIYAGLDQFDLDVRTVSSIVYQFDRTYLLSASASSKNNNLFGPTRVLLSESFLNLYRHEIFYHSLSRYSKVFGALGITDQQLKEMVPMSISSSSSVGSLALSPNIYYSPKRFYKVFRVALVTNADLLRTRSLIDDKIYNKIRNLGSFSDLYKDNLDDDQIDIERSDKIEIIKLNSILTDIFGYSGYSILKSGFMAIEKTSLGYEFSAFAPDKKERTAILRKTFMFSIGSHSNRIKINLDYFRPTDSTILFFVDLLINGHQQGFNVEGEVEKIETKPQSPLGELLYPSSGSSYNRISKEFLAAQYEGFLALFSKDMSSNLIVSSRNIIFQGVWKLLKNAITDAVIISNFPNVIDNIKDGSNPNYPITYARAVEIVKELVLNYYYTYYLDEIYVPSQTHDYIHKIYTMIKGGTTSTSFKSKGGSSHNFFNMFDFTFDLNSAFNRKELVDVSASVAFYYRNIYSSADRVHRPAWSLRFNSIRSEVKDTTIKTFTFLRDIFNNYDPSVEHFSIFFHKSGVSGINTRTNLNEKIPSRYKSEEIEGTYIDVDRSDPQSVIDAIASITYYMQKYNAFVIVKEGSKSQNLNSLVICFDQRKVYRPDIIQSIITSIKMPNKYLSSYSEAHYNNWVNQYDQIYNIGNIYPIYLFHDVDKLPQLIVDSLRIFLGVNSRLVKLQQQLNI